MAELKRTAELARTTRETNVTVALNLDGSGQCEVQTGIGFFDHMLTAFTFWSNLDLRLVCEGDLEVDDHHTVEDCALTLGMALDRALADRVGIARFGQAFAPMDEALCRVALDLSGRPYCVAELATRREALGGLSLENVPHFFASLATAARMTLHVDVLRGENDHHKVEAAFKAAGLALRDAVRVTSARTQSTKGEL